MSSIQGKWPEADLTSEAPPGMLSLKDKGWGEEVKEESQDRYLCL